MTDAMLEKYCHGGGRNLQDLTAEVMPALVGTHLYKFTTVDMTATEVVDAQGGSQKH